MVSRCLQITEQDLHRLFAPFGPIHSVTLPTAKPTDDIKHSSERHRGFAFVWMLSHADAERALKGINGRVVGAKGKEKKTRREREEIARKKAETRLKAMRGEEVSEDEGDEEADGKVEGKEDKAGGEAKEGRAVAVDWALSKSKWEESVSQRQDDAMEVDGEEAEDEEVEEDKGVSSAEEDDEEAGGSDLDEDEDEEGVHERPHLPDTDVGTTLFVRNVPFEATEDDLRTL